MSKPKIICVVGARPNFMKIAPIMAELNKPDSKFDAVLIHTGQHYDAEMKHSFFDQLGIPEPDEDLEVGSGSHAFQTAEVMKRFEPVLDEHKPNAILVVGDVNSTIACALVAVKKDIPVIHVEAGLRSYDRKMPEEINRILTDQISDLMFTTERSAEDNLVKEGIEHERVCFVGNVMIDTLFNNVKKSMPVENLVSRSANLSDVLKSENGFVLLTLHRPSNVDDKAILERLLKVVNEISEKLPVIFPIHPRTSKKIEEFSLSELLNSPSICRMGPLSYLELLGVMTKAKVVLTDSGGIQEETTALGVPCVTLRENTERPITVTDGTNTIVGTDVEKIRQVVSEVLENGGKSGRVPEFWDGKAAERIVAVLEKKYC